MLKRRLTACALTAVLGVGLAGPVAGAGAESVNVVAAIKTVEHSFATNAAYTYLRTHLTKIHTPAQARAVLPRLVAVGRLYAASAKYVAASSAQDSAQVRGRALWVRAAQLGSQEFAAFVAEYHAELAGDRTGAKADLARGLSLSKRASTSLDAADKLLGLPKGA